MNYQGSSVTGTTVSSVLKLFLVETKDIKVNMDTETSLGKKCDHACEEIENS